MDTLRRNNLYDFIVTRFSEYDFNRTKAGGDESEEFEVFVNYNAFKSEQRKIVDLLDINTLSFCESLKAMIEASGVALVDKESMAQFDSDGFYFMNGKIVISNSQ